MLLLFKYSLIKNSGGAYNLTDVKAVDFFKRDDVDIEGWVSSQSVDEVQELNS